MKIYLKWAAIIIGPFILIVAGIILWMTKFSEGYSREDLDESYNEDQVRRLQIQKAEKDYADELWKRQQAPKTGPSGN